MDGVCVRCTPRSKSPSHTLVGGGSALERPSPLVRVFVSVAGVAGWLLCPACGAHKPPGGLRAVPVTRPCCATSVTALDCTQHHLSVGTVQEGTPGGVAGAKAAAGPCLCVMPQGCVCRWLRLDLAVWEFSASGGRSALPVAAAASCPCQAAVPAEAALQCRGPSGSW